jgi:hypothetical protein
MSDLIPVNEAAIVPTAQITPMQVIQQAVAQGANVDQLERLMALQERYDANEAKKAFVAALNEFKRNPPKIHKTKTVSYGAGKTSYKHASLDDVSRIIGDALATVGISHRWDTEQLEGGLIRVTCVLTHKQGHSERVPLQASPDSSGSKNSIQAVGSTVSYLQRYTLLSATGMAVSEQDDDGLQGKGKQLSDADKTGFTAQIEACETSGQAESLWQEIAKATTECGDVPAYAELKAALAAKMKKLKAPKPTEVKI